MASGKETGGHRKPSLASSNPLARREEQKKKTPVIPNPVTAGIKKYLANRFDPIGT
jgi:hypothetical protein